MGDGRWAMGDGRWAMGDGRWAMGDGRWAMGERRTANGERRAVGGASRKVFPPRLPGSFFLSERFCRVRRAGARGPASIGPRIYELIKQ